MDKEKEAIETSGTTDSSPVAGDSSPKRWTEVHALGIDAGSAYVSVVAMDSSGKVVGSEYVKHNGNVVETVRAVLSRRGVKSAKFAAKTGNAAFQIENAGAFVDTTVAIMHGVKRSYEDVRNIIYVGAGSFYLIMLNERGEYLRHTENTACASGTGAFLEQQALRLGTDAGGLHRLARNAKSCPPVATRCAVFAKTDIIHLQQEGYTPEDIAAGICRGMAASTLETLLKGRTLEGKTVLTGGVAKNTEIVRYVEEILGMKVEVPETPELVGALGAAVCAVSNGYAEHDVRSICKADNALTQRLRRPPLKLEKSVYPDFSSFDFHINADGTEVTFPTEPVENHYDVVLGIDIGSTSTKAVLLKPDREPLMTLYRKTAGNPVEATRLVLKAIREESRRYSFSLNFLGVGTTGSGRKFVRKVLGADFEINEITAHARAAVHIDPSVDTILEIGGQDSKFTQLKNGVVYNSTMNYVCAAGTGSFIEEQAKRLDISIWEYGDTVMGVAPPRTSDRCTVFMERDLDVLLAEGWSKKEVAAAVLYSVCENYLNKVVAGQHIGERVYFQGATARNKALVAAFEQTLGKPIIVSPYCHLTGAYGTALLMLDKKFNGSTFRGLEFVDADIRTTKERCTLCRNECELTVVEIEGEKVGWGMKCGKEYEHRSGAAEDPPTYSLFKLRNRLLHQLAGKDPEKVRFNAGMPMSLTTHLYLPLCATMLRKLGGAVVLSGTRTRRSVMEKGIHYTRAEFCAPVVASHGHVAELAEKGVDFVFLPHMIRSWRDEEFTDSHFCPYVQGHPSVIKASRIPDETSARIISPVVELCRGTRHVAKRIHEELSALVDVSLEEVEEALKEGLEQQKKFQETLREEGKKVIRNLEKEGKMGVVIFGRPYNVNDPGLNVDLPWTIAGMGITVIPMDCVEEGPTEERWHNTYWYYVQKILKTAKTVVESDNLFGILFTNFSCGPDSYLLTYFKETMAEREKPFLVIQFDAHGADAGYVTRVEAALESFKAWKPVSMKHPTPFRQTSRLDRRRTIFFPPMDPVTVHLFTAAFRGAGYRAEVLEENEETLDVGYKHTLGSECAPCPSTLGSFIRTVEERNLSPSETALFMPTAHGPCRFGQYATLDKLVLEKKGWGDVEIISPSSDNAYLGLPASLRRLLWKAILTGDILSKMVLKIRPYEKVSGCTDAVMARSLEKLKVVFENGGRGLENVLAEIVEDFRSVERTNVRKPKVGIVGEIYVRCNDFLNQRVARYIEEYGGEAMRTTIAEWIFYTEYMHEYRREKGISYVLERVKNKLQRFYFNRTEHGLYSIASSILADRMEPSIEEVIEAGRRYVPVEFEGEAILTVGRAIVFMEKEGAAAIVNVSPAFCMPGTTTTAIFARIEEERGIPIICNFYDGSGEPNRSLRPYMHCLTGGLTAAERA